MDLEVQRQIPQTWGADLFLPSLSVLMGYSRRQEYSYSDVCDSDWLDLFASEIFHVLFTPLIGHRVLFAFFELMCVGIWL